MPYLDSFVKETARLNPGPIRKPATERRDRSERFRCRVLTRNHPTQSALLAKSWFHISPLMAITFRLATGSPYHKSRSCAMRKSGRVVRTSKRFASSMKRMARQSLDSHIRVTSFHSGDQFGMPGEPALLLLLRLRYNASPHSFVLSRQARSSTNAVTPRSRPTHLLTVPTNAYHESIALHASTYPS